jgi:hypothetical protein
MVRLPSNSDQIINADRFMSHEELLKSIVLPPQPSIEDLLKYARKKVTQKPFGPSDPSKSRAYGDIEKNQIWYRIMLSRSQFLERLTIQAVFINHSYFILKLGG